MARLIVVLGAAAALAGCARKSASEPVAGVLPNPVVEYRCESGEQIAVRLDGVAAVVRVNGVDYTLPQLSSVAGVSTFSDGRHVLEIRQGRTFFALGRSTPRLCTAQ